MIQAVIIGLVVLLVVRELIAYQEWKAWMNERMEMQKLLLSKISSAYILPGDGQTTSSTRIKQEEKEEPIYDEHIGEV